MQSGDRGGSNASWRKPTPPIGDASRVFGLTAVSRAMLVCSRFALASRTHLGHHGEEFILAGGEVDGREAERVLWDVIVVGTGMGGGMLGHS
ncbi:MAG: hypothetical protein WCI74_06295, partial [Actinomycetes bacterium]